MSLHTHLTVHSGQKWTQPALRLRESVSNIQDKLSLNNLALDYYFPSFISLIYDLQLCSLVQSPSSESLSSPLLEPRSFSSSKDSGHFDLFHYGAKGGHLLKEYRAMMSGLNYFLSGHEQMETMEGSDNFYKVLVKFLVGKRELLKYPEFRELKESAMASFKSARARFLSDPPQKPIASCLAPGSDLDPVPQSREAVWPTPPVAALNLLAVLLFLCHFSV